MRRCLAIAVLVAGSTALVASASTPSLTVAPSVIQRGHVLLLKGNAGGCAVGDAVTLISRAFSHAHDFAGLPAVFAKVRSGGKFSTTTRIPATKAPGRYAITGRCGGGNLGFLVRIRVIAAARASLTVTPATVHRGRVVFLKGSADGCPIGDTVTLISRAFSHAHDFAGVPAVFAKVRSGGKFGTTTKIPATKAPGRYAITGRCGGGNLGFVVHLKVIA